MKKTYFLLFVILAAFFISGCCKKPVELGKYPISDKALEILPYTEGQVVEFVHSNGYVAKFKITEKTMEWIKSNHCVDCFCESDYFWYQKNIVKMECEYPFTNVEFVLTSYDSNNYFYSINVNNKHDIFLMLDSNAKFSMDTMTFFYDTLVLNQKEYYDVIEKKFDYYEFMPDKDSGRFESVLFNKTNGLIQLKLSENETFTLK